MKKQAKSILLAFLALGVVAASSCSKKDPQPEIPQEEVELTKLVFEEVEWNDGQAIEIENPEIEEVEFDDEGRPTPSHIHLDAGKTYKLTLVAYNFMGEEMQHEFVDDADTHQAFILGAPDEVLDYTYADPNNARVGVTGYLHVLQASDGFVLNYIMRHLSRGVKEGITAQDWNNENYTQFGGTNDLSLKFELHPVDEEGHGH